MTVLIINNISNMIPPVKISIVPVVQDNTPISTKCRSNDGMRFVVLRT